MLVLKSHSERFEGKLDEMRRELEKELELPRIVETL
jgi:hypothetical protein